MDSKPIIRFRCLCGKKLKADSSLIGKKVKCTECNKINLVPEESTALPTKKRTTLTQEDVSAVKDASPSGGSSSRSQAGESAKFKGDPGPPPPAKRKKKKRSKKPAASPKATPKTSVPILGDDSSVNNDASLLPRKSDTADRFKQPPELDPEPSEDIIGVSDSFDFDPDLIDYSSTSGKADASPMLSTEDESNDAPEPIATSTKKTKTPARDSAAAIEIDTDFEPRFKLKKESKLPKVAIYGGIALAGVIGIVAGVYMILALWGGGANQFPESFESLSEVKRYRTSSIKYEKARRQFRIMGEAYEKSYETTEEEQTELQNFLEETKRDHQEKLEQAFKMIESDQAKDAKSNLREASKELDQTRQKITARATEFQQNR